MEIASLLSMSSAAGLNAYIPILFLGLAARYTDWVILPAGFNWLSNPIFLITIAILLVVELVADKIPVVDHINDTLQTLIRPISGGVVGGSVVSSGLPMTDIVSNSSQGTSGSAETVFAVVVGVLVAFGIHTMKATARPGVNVTTAGIGAPVVSTAGDISSIALSFLAVFAPIIAMVFLVATAAILVFLFLKLRKLRHERYRKGVFHDV